MKKKATIYIVDSLYNNYRIDLFLSLFMNISRNESLSLLHERRVLINGIDQIKKSKKIFSNDKIEILIENNNIIKKENELISISIIFINDDFLIINKPPFISCHKTNKKDTKYTIADFAKYYWTDSNLEDERFGIVHRLDKETSGILIIARTTEIKNTFISLFKEKKIQKKYIAFIEKGLQKREGIIKYNIMRDPLCPVKMTFSIGQGKIAETKYNIIEEKKEFTIIECFPKTGRTHQIRVHFQSIGFPIIGDKTYGKESNHINRQALHASEISFILKETKYVFQATIPEDMEILIKS